MWSDVAPHPEDAENDRQRQDDRDVGHDEQENALTHGLRIAPPVLRRVVRLHGSQLRNASASRCRNRPTSVTTPTVCMEPRSLSFVTTRSEEHTSELQSLRQ